MARTKTVYNGSEFCACGALLTPLEVMYGDLCPDCRKAAMQALISNRMVEGKPDAP